MQQRQVSVNKTIVISGEADNSRDLAEDVGGIIVHFDIVISEGDCDPFEMIVVLEINTVSRRDNPLISYECAATEMTAVNPHGNLDI